MAINKDFEDLFRCLNNVRAKFLVVGAYAVIFYTEPRYTKDLDIWVEPSLENSKKVYDALKQFGAPVRNISAKDLTNPTMVYQIGVEPNRIDILMGIGKLSFLMAWKNKKISHYGTEKIYILDMEDLVRAKKYADRPHDRMDVQRLLQSVAKKKKIHGVRSTTKRGSN